MSSELETVFILLFVVATAVAILARRYRVPYTVALVVTGLVLGALHTLEPPHLTREMLFGIFLPALLFEAAFHLEAREFWRNRVAIFSLAIPGVAGAIIVTALILTPVTDALDFVQGFDWRTALVFGALIAATDPISVIATFKSLGAPKRLATLVEGESLLNDGTAIVFFTMILGIVAGREISAGGLVADFAAVVGAGALIGATIGFAVAQVIRRVDDPMIEITLTTIAAYGAFVTAEQFHYSGVIATVVAGMLCGNYAARVGMSPSTRIAVQTFWEYAAFALNSIVFLLIGFEVRLESLLANWLPILVAYLAVTLGRAVVIVLVSLLLARTRERMPLSWAAVLSWGGLRGGLSMVLVLGLPLDFPQRTLLVTMTFGVVILSILLQGLTIAPLLRRLGIVRSHEARTAYERARGELHVAHAALGQLDEMRRSRFSRNAVLESLQQEYEERAKRAEATMDELRIEQADLREEELLRTRRRLLLAERDQAMETYREGLLSDEVYQVLLADIDARLVQLEDGESPAVVTPAPLAAAPEAPASDA